MLVEVSNDFFAQHRVRVVALQQLVGADHLPVAERKVNAPERSVEFVGVGSLDRGGALGSERPKQPGLLVRQFFVTQFFARNLGAGGSEVVAPSLCEKAEVDVGQAADGRKFECGVLCHKKGGRNKVSMTEYSSGHISPAATMTGPSPKSTEATWPECSSTRPMEPAGRSGERRERR